jgi:hypothetical protein
MKLEVVFDLSPVLNYKQGMDKSNDKKIRLTETVKSAG